MASAPPTLPSCSALKVLILWKEEIKATGFEGGGCGRAGLFLPKSVRRSLIVDEFNPFNPVLQLTSHWNIAHVSFNGWPFQSQKQLMESLLHVGHWFTWARNQCDPVKFEFPDLSMGITGWDWGLWIYFCIELTFYFWAYQWICAHNHAYIWDRAFFTVVLLVDFASLIIHSDS